MNALDTFDIFILPFLLLMVSFGLKVMSTTEIDKPMLSPESLIRTRPYVA